MFARVHHTFFLLSCFFKHPQHFWLLLFGRVSFMMMVISLLTLTPQVLAEPRTKAGHELTGGGGLVSFVLPRLFGGYIT